MHPRPNDPAVEADRGTDRAAGSQTPDERTGPWEPEPAVPAAQFAAAGRFQLLEELARGGMGVVYRARDPDLGRDVAVKVLQDRFAPESPARRRFILEARVTGQLEHPGVPAVHELGDLPDGRPYLAMKLVAGRTLADLLAARGPGYLDLPRFLPAFENLCQAVAFAHSRGVIHRDLKPQNVMVGAFGEVQVMDWGLAKEVRAADPGPGEEGDSTPRGEEETQSGTVLGTPAYMPPEQARGDVDFVDERADVFALGAILCVILTGRPPYTGTGPEVQAQAIVGDLGPAFARLDASGADPELVALCKRCLADRPADRPTDARAVADAVTGYREGVAERLRAADRDRAAAAARAVEERKRRRVRRALVASLFVVVGLIGFGAYWEQRRATDRARRDADEHLKAVERQAEDDRRRVADEQRRARDRLGAEAALAQFALLQKRYLWDQARAALDQGDRQVGADGDPVQRAALAAARADLDLIADLDRIRLGKGTGEWHGSTFGVEPPGTRYAARFRAAGLDFETGDVGILAARVAASPVRDHLVGVLEDWALYQRSAKPARQLWAVTARVTGEAWRAGLWNLGFDKARITRLAADLYRGGGSPALFLLVAAQSDSHGVSGAALLEYGGQKYPEDFWLAFELGEYYMNERRKNPALAAAAFRTALALRPTSAAAHMSLGMALEDKGDAVGAKDAMTTALRLDPNLADVHVQQAAILRRRGKLDEAIAAARKAVELSPDRAAGHAALGSHLYAKGEQEAAIACYREAIRRDPKYAPAYHHLQFALTARNDLDGALRAAEEGARQNPDRADVHNRLGNAWRAKGDPEAAIRHYKRAVEVDDTLADAHYDLGQMLMAKGEVTAGLKEINRALQLDPRLKGPAKK